MKSRASSGFSKCRTTRFAIWRSPKVRSSDDRPIPLRIEVIFLGAPQIQINCRRALAGRAGVWSVEIPPEFQQQLVVTFGKPVVADLPGAVQREPGRGFH